MNSPGCPTWILSTSKRLYPYTVILFFLSLFISESGIAATLPFVLLLGCAVLFCPNEPGTMPWSKSRLRYPVLALMGIQVLSLLGALAWHRLELRDHTFWKALFKTKYLLLYFPLRAGFRNSDELVQQVVSLSTVVAMVSGIVALSQFVFHFCPLHALHFIHDDLSPIPFTHGLFCHARGFLRHHNLFSLGCWYLFLLQWVALAQQKGFRTPIKILALLLALGGLIMSGSRSSWLAATVASLVLAGTQALTNRQGRPVLWTSVGVCAMIFVLLMSPLRGRFTSMDWHDNPERVRLWQMASQLFRESPLLGWGYHAGFQAQHRRFLRETEKGTPLERLDDPHSVYWDLLSTTGILGLFAFLWLFFQAMGQYLAGAICAARSPAREAQKRLLLAGISTLAAFLVASAFETHLYHSESIGLLVFMLALCESALPAEAKLRFKRHLECV